MAPVLIALTLIIVLPIVSVALARWRRVRLARRVNRPMVVPDRALVIGPLRDAASSCLLGAAIGDGLRRYGEGAPVVRYGIAAQLMMCALRSIRPEGALAPRRYRLELGYLHKYALGSSWQLRRTLIRARRLGLDRVIAGSDRTGDVLLVGLPVGVIWHDRPGRGARLASEITGVTHAAADVRDAAGLVAVITSRCIQQYTEDAGEPIHGRRAFVERILQSVGGAEGAAAVSILPIADLATLDTDAAREHLSSENDALAVLPAALYLLLHHGVDAEGALRAAAALGLPPAAAALACGWIGARSGRSVLADTWIERLQDRGSFEIQGERLAMTDPQGARPMTTRSLSPRS